MRVSANIVKVLKLEDSGATGTTPAGTAVNGDEPMVFQLRAQLSL
jgi:hypothetical protein